MDDIKKYKFPVSIIFVLVFIAGGIYLYNNEKISYSIAKPESKIEDITISEISQITGQHSINQTEEKFDVTGTDLGSIFDLNDTLYYVFGDTFGNGSQLPPGTGHTANWRSNVVAYSKDVEPADGIDLDGFLTDDSGSAKELIPSNKIEGDHLTSIPTYGVSDDNSMYLYYMAVDSWGDPGYWQTSHSGVYKSEDKGETWQWIEDLTWGSESNFTQVAIVKPEQNEKVLKNDIYFYGVAAGRHSNIQLMKVNKHQIENKESYQYFTGVDKNGVPLWSGQEKEAKSILDTTAGELSVVWNPDLKRWIMTYINGDSTNIDIVEAENPWGPWTDPKIMVAQREYPGLYGSYMHPSFIKDEGQSIYFTMSRWDPYNTFLMKAELKLN